MGLRLSHGGEKRHAKSALVGRRGCESRSVISVADVCWGQWTLIKYGGKTTAALITWEEALKKGELQHQGGTGRAIAIVQQA